MSKLLSPVYPGCALLAGLIALSATSASATSNADLLVTTSRNPDTRIVTIAVSDLNLASVKDRNTLAIRINNAARTVCDINDGSKLDRLPDARACFTQAREGAIAQLESSGIRASAAVSVAGLR